MKFRPVRGGFATAMAELKEGPATREFIFSCLDVDLMFLKPLPRVGDIELEYQGFDDREGWRSRSYGVLINVGGTRIVVGYCDERFERS